MPRPQAVYDGEVTIQAGFNTSLLFELLPGLKYDEPLTGAEATACQFIYRCLK
jgi:hypothetical protein